MCTMMRLSLVVFVCVLSATTVIYVLDRLTPLDFPSWTIHVHSSILFLTLASLAFCSACSLAVALTKTCSSSFKASCDVILVDVLTNKLSVSLLYSACWIPILLSLASSQFVRILENYDKLSPLGEMILKYHCVFLRSVPAISMQTLALSAIALPMYKISKADDWHKTFMKLALILPVGFRLILHIFVLSENTVIRYNFEGQVLPFRTSMLFCDVEIESSYLEVERYELLLTLFLCLVYSILHLPAYIERILPNLAQESSQHEKPKSEKETHLKSDTVPDVVGFLALFWTLLGSPLLLLHVQSTNHTEWTSCLIIPSHILLLFATILLHSGHDPVCAKVMEVKGYEEEEEEDILPFWLTDEKRKEEVERQRGEKENQKADDVYPLEI
ncbi:uncharacterized protein LOC122245571 isoform X2 [Penaeus japonicus]|uniref:uncharacterized protein LOC122245571 isoform X2 n=1 Tax=Penaeus japonicus TaxID=27405 RepID=UPI001C71306D|nr:uncharacterized protein LOC122245571 isoform X2 [Penaeus japonicus]